ncbi:hypothetical protein FisN_6Hh272 [Fistulifera solaris]|uniref:Uncharacterized protein n=1 Tax=Fistulifera solaris TaxID=1519565 RepID=A0A1Z5K763_FISSO|nr:hypothetical protein FisN_6Hh272 [Fistulifera solaris]|eukprot:GAX22025.1 hypothetical protein FisN_6Hh272 [Fistulifera solaris]
MSLRTAINSLSPPMVASAGIGVLATMPWMSSSGVSLAVLQGANAAAFGANCLAVSIPGRIDGTQDQEMRPGLLRADDDPYEPPDYTNVYSPSRGRTLVAPSGWAFAIWGPIYAGEAIFTVAQFFPQSGLALYLPAISAPFIAANLFQSLWCASFRPQYQGWASYISVAMLGGTAYSLSQVHAVACTATGPAYWFLLPLSIHFGWTTAATLVNLSGSVAMSPENSDEFVTAIGHSSAVLATALGVGLTLSHAAPVYGLTLAWALSACADGMKTRDAPAAKVMQKLCWTGALACATAAAYTFSL